MYRLLLLIAALSGTVCYAQGPYFKPLDLPNEFDDIRIELTYTGANGLLWIGTDHGLYKFNGQNFINYSFNTDTLDNVVTAIYSSGADTLWLGYASGQLAILNNETLQLTDIGAKSPVSAITDIEYFEGAIWFSTYGDGLYNYKNGQFEQISKTHGLSDNYVYCLENDNHGRLWGGTDKGINILSYTDNLLHFELIGTNEGLADNIVTSLSVDGGGNIFIGTQSGGVSSVNLENMAVTALELNASGSTGEIREITALDNEIWMATEKSGLVQYTMDNQIYTRIHDRDAGLPDQSVRHVSKDDEGNLWIVTDNSRLTRTNLLFEIITIHENIHFGNINSLMADSKGNIWAFNENGLFRHSIEFTGKNTISKFDLPLADGMRVISLYEDIEGRVWAGTFGEGVFLIDPVSRKYDRFTMEDGLVDNNILGISGHGNEIWFATLGGVSRCSARFLPGDPQFVTFNEEDGLGNNYVYSVYEDPSGRVWFATDGNGVTKFENNKFTNYSLQTGDIQSNVVYSITGDDAGRIWFSTLKEGIYEYSDSKFKKFDQTNGLSNLNITSLITDNRNNLVIAHKEGIDIYNLKTGMFSYYAEEYGLDNINPDLNTATVDINGDIWIGSSKGLIKFSIPGDQIRRLPRTILEEPQVFLENYDFSQGTQLSHNKNYLSFDFIGLWYQNSEAVTYQYQLEGYDPTWVMTRDHRVIYPNLPAGNYNFKVRSSANNTYADSEIQSFSFHIRRPFWQAWWFVAVLALLTFGVMYTIFRIREQRLKDREGLERARVLMEFESLKNQVNPHFLFNSFNSLINVIEDDSDKAVIYVEKLSDFFRNILSYRDKELITLDEELEIASNYFFIHKQRYGDLVTLDIEVKEEDKKRLIPPLTLQILLENAIKHNVISAAKPLHVAIYTDEKSIYVKNKLEKKRGTRNSTGTGLENVKNRFKLLSDKPVVITNRDGIFLVEVPLIKSNG